MLLSFASNNRNYQTECVTIETDGYVTIKIWDTKKGAKYKPEQARKDAIHAILFSGISGGNGCTTQPPILNKSEEQENFKTIEKSFFAKKGKWSMFTRSSATASTLPAKIRKQLKNTKRGKQKTIICYLAFMLFLTTTSLNAQQIIPGILYLNTLSEKAHPGENRIVQNDTLFDIFQQYGVYSYEQAVPFARTPSLWKVYKIKCTGNVETLRYVLEQQASELVTNFMYIHEQTTCYSPVDELWEEGKLWHLEKIQADSAWDMTRSNDSIDVAVLDWFPPDIYHPDLFHKINPPYRPMSGEPYTHLHTSTNPHATAIAGFIAGETTEIGGQPEGRLASVGFNTNMIFYQENEHAQIYQALHASTVMKAEVISISSFSGCGGDTLNTDTYAALQEILDNNTVIVAAAGNGNECNGGPLGIFNGLIFDEIIVVSGTDSTDHFQVVDNNGDTSSFSHYPSVDLCAPGYKMISSTNTWIREYEIDTITGDTLNVFDSIPNPYLYPGWWSGTSFSAPIVAGVAALIKSINPCLSPEDVQTILKSTIDPIVDANVFPGQVGTGRLNAYKAVKLAYESYNFQNYTVQSGEDLTWNNPHFIDTLYIEPNGKLTINANCFFNAGGEVFIDTLALLTVNNATLTTTCGNMWYGIEVWGDINASQYPDTNYNYVQGRLVLNGATLKNAHEAVSLWKDGDFNSTGGYVIAENSNFINNRRAVAFMSYHNYHPISQNQDRNFSRFNNCEFVLDEDYFGKSPFHGMVSMWDVEGVSFSGCDFINNRDSIYNGSGSLIDDSLSGFGILSVDGGFEVGSLCNSQTSPCPPQDIDSSRFTRFEYGIHAINSSGKNTIAVKSSVFDANITGLYTSALMQPTIIFNTFNVNAVDTSSNQVYGGVYLDNTTGFIVEENVFKDHQQPSGPLPPPVIHSVGLCINNSGSDDNFVYNNTFEDLYVGVLAQNHNRSNNSSGFKGLEIRCNEFFNIQYDIAVTADSIELLTSGIRGNQGSDQAIITAPAGNIFSPYNEQPTVEAWDIYTETFNLINYWYHTNQNNFELRPDSITQFWVMPHGNDYAGTFSKALACPSNFTGGGIEDLKNIVVDNDFKADSISNLLSLLVDGGDTDATTIDVETAWPDETMEVRADLLVKSPYLSDTVMVTTVQQQDVLPAAIVTEILTANPQSAKSDQVLDEVYARPDITNSQIDQIEANDIVTGAKESLEIRKAHYTGQRTYALNRLIATYKTDTSIANAVDSIIAMLNTQDFASAKYQLAFEYFAKGELQMAQDILHAIDDNYELDTEALNEHTQLEAYMTLMVQLAQSNNNIYQLSAAQKINLYNIHLNSNGLAGAWATNILRTVDTLSYEENYLLPTVGNKTGVVRRKRPDNKVFESNKLKVYPNPAKDYVIVEYQLVGDLDRAVIKVIDNNGFIRQTIEQENNHGFTVIDTRSLETGTYVCHVAANGKLVGVAKFIILQ